MDSGVCALWFALAATLTKSWAITSPMRDTDCTAADEIMSEVTSLLQDIKSPRVGLAGEQKLVDIARDLKIDAQTLALRGTGVVLHMHFDNHQWSNNIVWFLENTRICHPDNFVACLFVSDWDGVDAPDLSKWTQGGADIRLVDCAANKAMKLPSTNETWPAFYVHKCYAESFKLVRDMAGVHGILFLEDDTAVVRPWKALAVDLLNHGGIVVPGIQDNIKQDTNLLDNSTWPTHGEDQWFWDGGLDTAPVKNPSMLLSALLRFNPEEQRRLGITNLAVPVFKASADVLYVPLSQGADFERLADSFVESGIFVEYAVSNIARGIDGEHALLGPHEKLLLKSIWHETRADPFSAINDIRLSIRDVASGPDSGSDVAHNSKLNGHPYSPYSADSNVAFVHPVKLGGPLPAFGGVGNREKLKALYDVIFA